MCLEGLDMGCFYLTQIQTFQNCSLERTAAPDPEAIPGLVAICYWANTFQALTCYG